MEHSAPILDLMISKRNELVRQQQATTARHMIGLRGRFFRQSNYQLVISGLRLESAIKGHAEDRVYVATADWTLIAVSTGTTTAKDLADQ